MSSMQGTVTCAVMTKMGEADRVLEVACGPGKHSIMLAQSWLKKGGVLVSCDYSGAMMQCVAKNYNDEDNDFNLVPGNKSFIDTTTDFISFTDETCKSLKN